MPAIHLATAVPDDDFASFELRGEDRVGWFARAHNPAAIRW